MSSHILLSDCSPVCNKLMSGNNDSNMISKNRCGSQSIPVFLSYFIFLISAAYRTVKILFLACTVLEPVFSLRKNRSPSPQDNRNNPRYNINKDYCEDGNNSEENRLILRDFFYHLTCLRVIFCTSIHILNIS